jgi:hypothetical protein
MRDRSAASDDSEERPTGDGGRLPSLRDTPSAVSALVMGAHAANLEKVPSLSDDMYRIEGKIWRPM